MALELGEVRTWMRNETIKEVWKIAEDAVKSPQFGKSKMWVRLSQREDDFHPRLYHRSYKVFDRKPTPLLNTIVYYVDWDRGYMKEVRVLPKETNIILPDSMISTAEVVTGSFMRMKDFYL